MLKPKNQALLRQSPLGKQSFEEALSRLRAKGLKSLTSLFLLLGLSQALQAQQSWGLPLSGLDYQARHYWVSTEMSFGNATSGAIGLNAEFAQGWRLGMEYRHSSDGEFLAIFSSPEEKFDAAHLLLGKLYRHRAWVFDLKVGLGMGQRQLPINVRSSGWFGYNYDTFYDWEPSTIVSVEAGLNLAVFRPALQIGYSLTQRMRGPFFGLSVGFGKFF